MRAIRNLAFQMLISGDWFFRPNTAGPLIPPSPVGPETLRRGRLRRRFGELLQESLSPVLPKEVELMLLLAV